MSEPLQYACDEHDYQGFSPCPTCHPATPESSPADGVVSHALIELREAAEALSEIVEGVRCERWSSDGLRLKDTPEWCRFYVALRKATKASAPTVKCDGCGKVGPPNISVEGRIYCSFQCAFSGKPATRSETKQCIACGAPTDGQYCDPCGQKAFKSQTGHSLPARSET